MFLVGGGILVHGLPFLHHAVEAIAVPILLPDLVVGVVAGALALAGVMLTQRLLRVFQVNWLPAIVLLKRLLPNQ